jgi:hypothetical protein
MHYVSRLWRNLGPPLLWLWPLIIIDKELREFAVVKSRLEITDRKLHLPIYRRSQQ